eukprot:NODE_310_length_2979_cov_33.359944_g268_i0.p1 GENE.NODE_310_length_2979_cov_33.359944_g268_i0~~NODE_310_length_2979_cov_33.359944_g268_i0.p1  ORF type:complete len:943 (-),score=135.23 NODE_310_length_2979_cov_33.359944_g268_i0:151-2802(-)
MAFLITTSTTLIEDKNIYIPTMTSMLCGAGIAFFSCLGKFSYRSYYHAADVCLQDASTIITRRLDSFFKENPETVDYQTIMSMEHKLSVLSSMEHYAMLESGLGFAIVPPKLGSHIRSILRSCHVVWLPNGPRADPDIIRNHITAELKSLQTAMISALSTIEHVLLQQASYRPIIIYQKLEEASAHLRTEVSSYDIKLIEMLSRIQDTIAKDGAQVTLDALPEFQFLIGIRETVESIIETLSTLGSLKGKRKFYLVSPLQQVSRIYHKEVRHFVTAQSPILNLDQIQNDWVLGVRHFGEALNSIEFKYALKVGVTSCIISAITFALPKKDYKIVALWTNITVVIVMTGPGYGQIYPRTACRVIGSIVGSCYGWFVLWASTGYEWAILLLSAVFLYCCIYIGTHKLLNTTGLVAMMSHVLTMFVEYKEYKASYSDFGLQVIRWALPMVIGVDVVMLLIRLIWPYVARVELRRGVATVLVHLWREYALLCRQFVKRTVMPTNYLRNMESSISDDILQLQILLSYADQEHRMEGPFPTAEYANLISQCHILSVHIRRLRLGIGQDLVRWLRNNLRDSSTAESISEREAPKGMYRLWDKAHPQRKHFLSSMTAYLHILFTSLYMKIPVPTLMPDVRESYGTLVSTGFCVQPQGTVTTQASTQYYTPRHATTTTPAVMELLELMYFTTYCDAQSCIVRTAHCIHDICAQILNRLSDLGSAYEQRNFDTDNLIRVIDDGQEMVVNNPAQLPPFRSAGEQTPTFPQPRRKQPQLQNIVATNNSINFNGKSSLPPPSANPLMPQNPSSSSVSVQPPPPPTYQPSTSIPFIFGADQSMQIQSTIDMNFINDSHTEQTDDSWPDRDGHALTTEVGYDDDSTYGVNLSPIVQHQ